jgi:hypothetical protein
VIDLGELVGLHADDHPAEPHGGPQLRQREERQRPHPIGALDAVGGRGGPLVGVGPDLATAQLHANRRAPAAQQHPGLDVGHVQPHPHRTVAHAGDRAGQVGQFQGTRITLSP